VINFLYHVTLTTGHVRKSYPDEVDRRLYFVINRIIRDSQGPAGCGIEVPGYSLKTTQAAGQTLATLFGSSGAPILTTGISTNGDTELWRMMHESATTPIMTDPEKPPAGPYIADRIEIGAAMHSDALVWTADFARTLGWFIIAPERFR
jgi:hypothetical protein